MLPSIIVQITEPAGAATQQLAGNKIDFTGILQGSNQNINIFFTSCFRFIRNKEHFVSTNIFFTRSNSFISPVIRQHYLDKPTQKDKAVPQKERQFF